MVTGEKAPPMLVDKKDRGLVLLQMTLPGIFSFSVLMPDLPLVETLKQMLVQPQAFQVELPQTGRGRIW